MKLKQRPDKEGNFYMQKMQEKQKVMIVMDSNVIYFLWELPTNNGLFRIAHRVTVQLIHVS